MRRRSVMIGFGAAAVVERMRRLGANAAEIEPSLSPLLPQGTRDIATLEALPGKQRLIKLSYRPPNYEAPVETFRAALTPNDAFFVRYHLAGIPDQADLASWSLQIGGDAVERPVTLSRRDLEQFSPVEITAVNQCSGNRRGFSAPHVAGVQWGSGAMGNAVWRGARLADLLTRAGVKAGAVEVAFRGADGPVMDTTPPFQKSLPLAKAMEETVLIATAMNGEALPLLNGFPARLVVPGWTGTYWIKHLTTIEVRTKPLDSFWMQKAYRVPKGMFPVELPFTTQDDSTSTPITDIVVNSLITAPLEGVVVPAKGFEVRGVAWDHGKGIRSVEVSLDGGQSWQPAALGPDRGRFSFREFVLAPAPVAAGPLTVSARAVNNGGETQAERLKFNPAGYQNNVPQRVGVTAA